MNRQYTVSSLIKELNDMLVLGDTPIVIEWDNGLTADSIRVFEDLDADDKTKVFITAG